MRVKSRVEDSPWRKSKVESRNANFGFRISDCGLNDTFNPQSAIRNPQLPCAWLRSLHPREGLTLIELLAVIIILTTIVAAAIPIMAPSNDDRRLREATRGLNTFISGAQARA